MKNLISIISIANVAIVSLVIVTACAQNGNRPGLQSAPGADANSPVARTESLPSIPRGTTDSGGGTGVDNKIFESFIVVPTDLPAYKEFLAPLFENIKSEESDQKSLAKMFQMKTWYIAPVDFNKIDKDVLGVSFMKSDTQQIARQTDRAVWIDKRIYDNKMKSRDQADTILHEYVMSLYFLKFKPMSEICKLSNFIMNDGKGEGCLNYVEAIDKGLPPEKAHPLTAQDNDNIRDVTAWFLQNATKPLPEKELMRVLFAKGFDKRIFNPGNYGKRENLTNLKVSPHDILMAINAGKLTGKGPEVCTTLESKQQKPCAVDAQESKTKITYSLTDANGNIVKGESEVASIIFILNIEGISPITISTLNSDEIELSASENGDGTLSYTHILTEYRDKFHVGDRAYLGFLIFRYEAAPSQSAGLILDSVIIKPGVIVDVNKGRDPVCRVRSPKATSWLNDGIIATSADSKLTVQTQLYAAVEPMVTCSKENVE